MNQISGEKLKCPHCDSAQGDVIDDYVVPGETGEGSSAFDECQECGGCFTVMRIDSKTFEVLKEDAEAAEEAAYYSELNRGYAQDRA